MCTSHVLESRHMRSALLTGSCDFRVPTAGRGALGGKWSSTSTWRATTTTTTQQWYADNLSALLCAQRVVSDACLWLESAIMFSRQPAPAQRAKCPTSHADCAREATSYSMLPGSYATYSARCESTYRVHVVVRPRRRMRAIAGQRLLHDLHMLRRKNRETYMCTYVRHVSFMIGSML